MMRNKSLLIIMLALVAPLAMWGQETLPYEYGFENATGTSGAASAAALEEAGWAFINEQGTIENAYYAVFNSAFKHSGQKSFRMKSAAWAVGYLISPELPATESGVTVEFYYAIRTDSPTQFRVGYSMTTSDPTDFVWGELVYLDEVNAWQKYEKDFPANVKYIAIAKPTTGGFLFVDDFTFSEATCAVPTTPHAEPETQSILLSWTGNSDSYSLKYAPYYNADFVEDWCGWAPAFGSPSWELSLIPDFGYCYYEPGAVISDVSLSHRNNYLVSPAIPAGSRITFFAYGLTLMGDGFKKQQLDPTRSNFDFKVMVATVENPTLNDFVQLGETFTASDANWNRYTIDLSSYTGICHVAICHVYSGKERPIEEQYLLVVDDITITYPWEQVTDIQSTNYTIANYGGESLDPETYYSIKLKGSCDQWTDAMTVPTHPTVFPDTYEFVTNGNWNVAENWRYWMMPPADGDVIINARARIPAGYVAEAGTITVASGPTPKLTIAEGGQLRHSNTDLKATMEKYITGYTNEAGTDHYYLLAFPVVHSFPIEGGYNYVNNLVYNSPNVIFDLYTFDQNEELEWVNYEDFVEDPDNPGEFIPYHQFNTIHNGKGYLYSRSADGMLTFNTEHLKPSNADVAVSLNYIAGKDFAGWNLIGNPFACNAYLTGNRQFYRLAETDEGSMIVLATDNVIAPMEGIFVQASTTGEQATFTANDPQNSREGMMDFTLRKATTKSADKIDRTRVVFGEGNNMGHLDLMSNPNRLYFPIDDEAIAVVYSQPMGELPLNLDVATEGTFVLGFECHAERLVYCHLIDNLTGADIDLLQTPEYSFESRKTDYASRFRVLFAKADANNDTTTYDEFAYFFNGNLVVSNEGPATLQVIDIQGRIIKSESIEGDAYTSMSLTPGVYVLRLVSGYNVKVQKVVVK